MSEIVKNLVSTIIPVYNRPGLLKEAVESVIAQTYRPIEIIISDDGSTDDTPKAAGELVKKYPDEIIYIRNENRGAGPAREAGRQIARGEFIQYLDSDDLLLPRKFEVQIAALRENPDCGAAYGRTRLVTMDGKVLFDPYKLTGVKIQYLFPRLLVDRWWNTQTPLFRRSVCDEVGSWSNFRYSQDWEYDGRIGSLGTRLAFCQETVCDTRVHSNKRQTGHGKWLEPKERGRFFTLLFGYAAKAGVEINSTEMRHFSRWLFSNARECGKMGDSESARRCFELAVKAVGIETGDLKIYRFLSQCIGWDVTGKLSCLIDMLPGRRPGTDTQKLSWMEK